jgi:polyribonucleotide nucleotidyltransferase
LEENNNISRFLIEVGGKEIHIELGRLARQADGAVLISCDETSVLVTAVTSEETREGVDFLPLTVDVEEKMYAAGKIPGGFFKREGRPSERSILTARLIDRPLRPCFPKDYRNDVQVIATILSVDQVNLPDVLAINGASLALGVSPIPFNGPIAAVRVGLVNDEWVVNPTLQELEFSQLDLVIAGRESEENGRSEVSLLMVEAEAKELPEQKVLEAFEEARIWIKKLIDFQKEIVTKVGQHKQELEKEDKFPELETEIKELAQSQVIEALHLADREERKKAMKEIEDKVLEELSSRHPEKIEVSSLKGEVIGEVKQPDAALLAKAKMVLKEIEKAEMRKMILNERRRADGRRPDEIRPISVEVGLLPRTHGSGLFTRGQTQVLTVATLGTVGEEQIIDGLEAEDSKRFIHHYNFPPFSTGEARPLRGPRRREIGHGALAEKALLAVIPPENEFPYTIRLVSEVLESNGSTSMASVCGSSLALMDAGIPIKAPVAGIAMGLIKEGENVAVLTDILGLEDALGDMDFKVAGTEQGITALQMDIKIDGLTLDIIEKALEEARQARLFILKKMTEVISEPRKKLSPYAPRVYTLKVDASKIGDIIGPGGKVIRGIIEETGATIDIEQDGTVFIAAKEEMGVEQAKQMIEAIVREVKVGERFLGTVTRVADFGAFVEVLPGKEGLVHISKLSPQRVRSAKDVVKVGEKILVEVTEIDSLNRINLATVDYLEAAKSRHKGHGRR